MGPVMRKRVAFVSLSMMMFMFVSIGLSLPTHAQRTDPIPYTPGVPLREVTATFSPNFCFEPFTLRPGDLIYIRPGVNIRTAPTRSSAIAWNTIFDNRDEDGEVIDVPLAVPASIVEGPVCAEGFNWWRVSGTGNPGWVAEGRPDQAGYFILAQSAAPGRTCDSRYTFAVGQTVTLIANARIREAPSTETLTRTIVPAGDPILITGGPQCVDGFLWWAVRAEVVNFVYEGWMAEGQPEDNYFLIPTDLPSLADGTLCANPRPFSAGMRGYVDYRSGGPKSLRTAPRIDATLLFSLVDGVPFVVEDGPVCSGNLNWWKITVLASAPVTGWMAEGSPGVGYWMTELRPDQYAR